MAGEVHLIGLHPGLEVSHQRRDLYLPNGQAFGDAFAVDRPLDLEQPIA